MGEIFLARLEGAAGFEKLFVIKRIIPHLASDSRFRAMLISEARIAANMSHANICQVYELDESDHQLYIVMEYLEGVTLLALLRKYSRQRRQLELGFIGGVIHQVAEGLHYAHELRDRSGELMRIVHRDVTPSNLFLTESGIAKVTDFGVAKAKGSTNTESGAIKGKFAYMAPEQLAGTEVDRRADIFGLGVVIAEMISNRRLFQRKTDYLTFRAVMEQPLPDFRLHRPDLPDALVPVLTRALARDRADRYTTVRELEAAVTQVIGRPWTQAEISELIRSDFHDELRRHHTEVSGVVNRSALRTMPTILESPSDPDAEDYFAFETSVEIGRRQASVIDPRDAEPRSDPRNQLRWRPIAMVGGAVVIGFVILLALIHTLRAPSNPTAAAPDERNRPGTVTVARAPEPYAEAIRARDGDLARCATRHGERLPDGAQAVVRIGVDGRARKISFIPEQVDRSALGNCLRDVFATTMFPKTTSEKELALGLALRK
jgi:serine/threonine protein kinase